MNRLSIEPTVPAHREGFCRILDRTEQFSEEEKDCAQELLEIYLKGSDEYIWLTALLDTMPVGFACYGEAALSRGTYDIYWIMVSKEYRRMGVGSRLLRVVEEEIKSRGGRKLLIETSSLPRYEGARAFYRSCGFTEEARIEHYYNMEDHKLIYTKTIRR